MTIRETLAATLKEALKGKDELTLATVRLILSALKDKDIAARTPGKAEGISEPEILSLLQGMVKQRQESAKIYREAGRADLFEREEGEIRVIERFLPRQMDDSGMEAAVQSVVGAVGAKDIKDMGKVMAALKTQYAGQMDMAKAGLLVKKALGG
jgi:uncharacterized protein YqeY